MGTITRHAYRITDDQVQGQREAALFALLVRLADAFDIHPPALYEPDGPSAAARIPLDAG